MVGEKAIRNWHVQSSTLLHAAFTTVNSRTGKQKEQMVPTGAFIPSSRFAAKLARQP